MREGEKEGGRERERGREGEKEGGSIRSCTKVLVRLSCDEG